MSAEVAMSVAADAAAGALSSMKRMAESQCELMDLKRIKVAQTASQVSPSEAQSPPPQTSLSCGVRSSSEKTSISNPKGREIRLEQNRKAAKESRRRKNVMIEELQRSVIFFSRANGALKQQNDELSRIMMQAQAQIAAIEGAKKYSSDVILSDSKGSHQIVSSDTPSSVTHGSTKRDADSCSVPQQTGTAAVTSSLNLSTVSAAAVTTSSVPTMQPGATMQAMANFQQAAAAAMQNAIQGMQNIPGMNLNQLFVNAPSGTNAQQAYTDTMTAIAMQQAAAAAAAGHHFALTGMPFFAFAWPQSTCTTKPEDDLLIVKQEQS